MTKIKIAIITTVTVFVTILIIASLKGLGLAQSSPVIEADYLIFKEGSTIRAKNGLTGNIDWSSSSFGTVLNNVVDNVIKNAGGKILIQKNTYTLDQDIILDDPDRPNDYTASEGGIIIFDFNGSSVTFDGSIKATVKPARVEILNLVVPVVHAPILVSRKSTANYGLYRSLISNVNILGGAHTAPAFDIKDFTENKFEFINAVQSANYPTMLIAATGGEGVNLFKRISIRRTANWGNAPYKITGDNAKANIQHIFVNCIVRDDGSYTNPAWDVANTFRNAWYSCNGDMYFRTASEDTVYDNQGGSLTLDSGVLWVDGGYFNNIKVNGGSLYTSDIISYNSLVKTGGNVYTSPNNYSGKYLKNSATASYSGSSKSFTVSHGLSATPKVVIITPKQTGQGNVWVTNKGSTTFTINFDTAPGSSAWYFDWYAE